MSREPMSDQDFKLLVKVLNNAKDRGENKNNMAHVAVGAFEALTNMTEDQIDILRTLLYGD